MDRGPARGLRQGTPTGPPPLEVGSPVCHARRMKSRKGLLVGITVVVWAIVTPFMWRDLKDRPRDRLRGPKWLWWVASANLSGSAAYWMFARRSGD